MINLIQREKLTVTVDVLGLPIPIFPKDWSQT